MHYVCCKGKRKYSKLLVALPESSLNFPSLIKSLEEYNIRHGVPTSAGHERKGRGRYNPSITQKLSVGTGKKS